MARPKKIKEVEPAQFEEGLTPEVGEVEMPKPNSSKEVSYPEVTGTGKFQAVKVADGFVVYNGCGQRVSNLLEEIDAKNIAHANNMAR